MFDWVLSTPLTFEIQNLKKNKIIANIDKSRDDYISCLFTESIKDGSHRMISNLKT